MYVKQSLFVVAMYVRWSKRHEFMAVVIVIAELHYVVLLVNVAGFNARLN
jgi:hypothetical protein